MASSASLFLLLLAIMTICAGAMNSYKVGDADGWRVPADNDPGFYETWASKIKFLVGDSIGKQAMMPRKKKINLM